MADLAASLGITDNAARMHVAALERDGLIRSAGIRRDTGGKPARLYDLTDRAEDLFPKAYAVVLGALIRELDSSSGREASVALLRTVGEQLARARAEAVPTAHAAVDRSPGAKVESAAEVLRGLGGDIDILETDEGWLLAGFGCPLSAVVAERQEACALAEALVAEITGFPVRERCDREERPRCRFHVLRNGVDTDPPALAGNVRTSSPTSSESNPDPAGHVNEKPKVVRNADAERFEIARDGELAYLRYDERGDRLALLHTEVHPALRGEGLASRLAEGALEYAAENDLTVVPFCPFLRNYIKENPESSSGVRIQDPGA